MQKSLQLVITMAQTLLQAQQGAVTAEAIAAKVKLAASVLAADFPEGVDEAAAIKELIRRFSDKIGTDTALQDRDSGHDAWLNAARKKNWLYWQRYQTYLERKMSAEVVEALNKSTDRVLGLLEDPKKAGKWDRRGLVVGHVQSGKTGHYSGLICKAADAGYKVIIVLAGMHNNLRSQTQIRLEESFLGYETTENHDIPGKRVGVGEIDGDIKLRVNCPTTRANKGDFNSGVAKHFANSPEERPWLFVVKKNKRVLTQLLAWIRGHVADTKDSKTGKRIVSNLPLLVVDDESDNASVDTGELFFNADGTPDKEHEPKAINSLIRKILNAFDKSAYVGYTATPFANIFIHRKGDTVEEGPDLFPQSFIVNLAAPTNYVGPTKVFGLRSTEGREGGLPLMRIIPDPDFPNELSEWMPAKHNKEHAPAYAGQDIVPPSLKKAVQSFMLACAARTLRGQGSEHSSMLVHVTRFASVQREVHRQVEEALKKMTHRLIRGVDSEALVAELRAIWEDDFVPTCAKVADAFPEAGGPPKVPTWAEVLAALPDAVADIEVKVINGTAKDTLDYAEREGQGFKVIAIGGEKLARGLTLEGLCVSYFVRTTKMYDTLMQMGRWFGYRPGYVDLCRLYTTSDLVDWFGHIADASEDLRAEFDLMEQSGATPDQYGMKVESHPVMIVTSPLKMRSAKNLHLSFSGDVLETVAYHVDGTLLDHNLATVNKLIDGMGAPAEINPSLTRAGKSFKWSGFVWTGVGSDLVADFLQQYSTHPDARRVNSKMLSEFVRSMAAGSKELTSWTVGLVGGGEGAPFVFHGGLKIDGMLERAADPNNQDRYSIGRLLSPRDEAIDLGDESWSAALKNTKESWKPDPARQKPGVEPKPPEVPSGPQIRKVRGLGVPGVVPPGLDRGLLLLYPLDPAKSGHPKLKGREKPIMGFGVSFPASESGVKVIYKVDHLKWEEEYGSTE